MSFRDLELKGPAFGACLPPPNLRAEWKRFSEVFFPGVPESELTEARRIFWAGAMAFDLLMVRATDELVGNGTGITNPESFLALARAVRSELYAEVLGDPESGLRG